jgi:3-oxoacyl-[acyl-carrier protein] reductase
MQTTSPTSPAALDGTVALVTGGSRGIGRAIASMLVSHGASVGITGRTAEDLERACVSLGEHSLGVRADIGVPEDVKRAVEETADRFGGVDVLVNNAGVGLFGRVADMPLADWRTTLDTNLSGVFHACQAALPHLKRRGGGWIINISSLAGSNPFDGGAAYCASKAGLNAFSEALMQEVRHDGIRVSTIAPGSVATGFSGRGAHGAADWKIQPEDVAQVVLDLLLMPARSLPSRIELRPSRPPKKA